MTQLSFDQLLCLLDEAEERVEKDQEYRHNKTGKEYIVADIVFREHDMSLQVLYYNPFESRVSFTRPIEEFLQKFTKIE